VAVHSWALIVGAVEATFTRHPAEDAKQLAGFLLDRDVPVARVPS